MNKTGPIIVIKDDADDQQLFTEIFENFQYQNKIIFFSDRHEAVEYLMNTDNKPFLVLSDIHMPETK